MSIIAIALVGFLVLETANVAALYFFPGSKMANSVGIFTAWERSKQDPEIHNLVRYLVNWVAGTKLIFILLLIVVVCTAGPQTQMLAGAALVISIATFFWRLFPLIRKMDRDSQIEPQGYSAALGWMILAMIILLLAALLISYIW